jgi:hypothetical protein
MLLIIMRYQTAANAMPVTMIGSPYRADGLPSGLIDF